MTLLNSLIARGLNADMKGGLWVLLAAAAVYIICGKTGHRTFLKLGALANLCLSISSFAVSWDVLHAQIKFIGVFSYISTTALAVFVGWVYTHLRDLRRTFEVSENCQDLRNDAVATDKMKVMTINFAAHQAEKKSVAMYEELLSERRG